MSISRTVRSTLLGVIVVASPMGAEALTVGRCNMLVDGVYKPVLVVENDGQKTIHEIGEDGLTRRIVFNANAALAWAVEKYGADAATSSSSNSCHDFSDTDIIVRPDTGGEGGYEGYGGEGNDSMGGGYEQDPA